MANKTAVRVYLTPEVAAYLDGVGKRAGGSYSAGIMMICTALMAREEAAANGEDCDTASDAVIIPEAVVSTPKQPTTLLSPNVRAAPPPAPRPATPDNARTSDGERAAKAFASLTSFGGKRG